LTHLSKFSAKGAMSYPPGAEDLDIDDALEKKAAENNLSVVNVKSIIHVRSFISFGRLIF